MATEILTTYRAEADLTATFDYPNVWVSKMCVRFSATVSRVFRMPAFTNSTNNSNDISFKFEPKKSETVGLWRLYSVKASIVTDGYNKTHYLDLGCGF